jgi:GntR family transcriptional repressor for pyruvate dehydrogenase complex
MPAPQKRTDAVLEAIREEIVSGRLAKGSRLPNEKDLASLYGVSQPTIREVVRALDVMGLVDVRHGSGAFVRGDSAFLVATALQTLLQIEKVSIIEVLDVRETLGRDSVRRAAAAATDEDLDALQRCLAVLEDPSALPDTESVIEAIASFQRTVSASAHNPLLLALESVLINLLLHIQIKALRKRDVTFWRSRSLDYQHHRREIVAALSRQAPEDACAAMEGYLEHQREAFMSDRKLSLMRLSDAAAVRASLDIVSAVRAV